MSPCTILGMNVAALTGSKRPVDREGDALAGDLIQGVASVGPANGESVVAVSPSEAQILSQGKANGLIVDCGPPVGKKGGRRISKKKLRWALGT